MNMKENMSERKKINMQMIFDKNTKINSEI